MFASDLVRPLDIAQNQFLQVLVTSFSIEPTGDRRGSILSVSFDEKTPAIWNRLAKLEVQRQMPDFERKANLYQRELDAVLLYHTQPSLSFADPEFPFRYCSGGTLPIVRWKGKEYYCLFYRDIFPVGWNIANGGTDSVLEMLNPMETINRELREELLILNPKRGWQYVFSEDAGTPIDLPEFAQVREFWLKRFPRAKRDEIGQLPLPVRWMDGPDELHIREGGKPARTIRGCFININALDFGIEIDRIAKIPLDDDAAVCDGEGMQGGRPISRLVGMFRVEKTQQMVREGRKTYRPDTFFWNVKSINGCHFSEFFPDEVLKHTRKLRTPEECKAYDRTRHKLDLCPVTRQIVKRHTAVLKPEVAKAKYDVFICWGGDDAPLARRVCRFLTSRGLTVFFSEAARSEADFTVVIEQALESAECLIGVATDATNLRRRFPQFEWTAFLVACLGGSKRSTASLLAFITEGFDPRKLPLAFQTRQWVRVDEKRPSSMRKGLQDLLGLVQRILSGQTTQEESQRGGWASGGR